MCLSYDQREYDFLNNFEYIWKLLFKKKKDTRKRKFNILFNFEFQICIKYVLLNILIVARLWFDLN